MSRQRRRGATLGDVARQAGVSLTAASFVLSGRPGGGSAGSDETKHRVLAAAEELDYVPNRHAKAIRTGRSDVISLTLGTIGDPWATSMAEAVQLAAQPHGLATVVVAGENWVNFMSGYPSAASLVTELYKAPGQAALLSRLARSGRQLVVYGAELEPDGFDVIATTPLPAINAAYRQLRQRHDHVSLLSHLRPGSTPWTNRADVFQAAVTAGGDSPDASPVVFAGVGRRESYKFALEWLSRPTRPTAVIGATAYTALAAQAAAHYLGLRVPDDLEIVSMGDVPEEALILDPVSYWGVRAVFSRTAQILLARALNGPDLPAHRHEFAWEFFPGSTTRDP